MIKLCQGNIFNSESRCLVNTVNCVGVMGKGLALAFRKRYPEMFYEYHKRCSKGLVRTGQPYLYRDTSGIKIVNFPTKDHWINPSKIEYIIDGLDYFIDHYEQWGIQSIAFPALGCSNGKLQWTDVKPVMYQKLATLPILVEIYQPEDT